jgi:hypothetical protein
MLQVNMEGFKVESPSVDIDVPWVALAAAGAVVGKVIQFFGLLSRRPPRERDQERDQKRQEILRLAGEIRRDCRNRRQAFSDV